MKNAVAQRYVARARIFKALAHPSRLCIVETLARGPRCVHELRDRIGDDLSTVSRHLSILRSVGIVSDEKRGAQVIYTLTAACLLKFISCVETVALHHARSRLREAGGNG